MIGTEPQLWGGVVGEEGVRVQDRGVCEMGACGHKNHC